MSAEGKLLLGRESTPEKDLEKEKQNADAAVGELIQSKWWPVCTLQCTQIEKMVKRRRLPTLEEFCLGELQHMITCASLKLSRLIFSTTVFIAV